MTIRNLEQQLMNSIDQDDLNEVKKIKRYIQLLKLDAACDVAIKKDGTTITVENGNQRYIKAHPAMTEKMKINTQLIALEKTIKFKLKTAPATASSSVEGKPNRGSLIWIYVKILDTKRLSFFLHNHHSWSVPRPK